MLMFLVPAPAAAGPEAEPTSLSLSAAVQRALAEFPSLRASQAAREEARAAVGEARAARLPALRLDTTATQYEEPMVVTPLHGFAPGQLPAFDETLIQGGVTLNYMLFNSGAREARILSARSQAASADADFDAAAQALIARVTVVYLDALGKRQVLSAHDRRLTALQSELSRVRRRFDAGRAARIEILRVEAALATAQADRVRDAQALDRAERDLARLIGASPDEIVVARLIPVALSDSPLAPRDPLKAQARESNSAVKQARERVAAAEAGLAVARSARWPELNLTGNYIDRGSGQGDYRAEWLAGVQLSYMIFTGGARSRGIARAAAARRGALEQLRLAELQVEQEIDHAFSAVQEAHARVESLETAVARSEEVARIQGLLLETGSGTETDYLNVEADLLEARADLVEARHAEIAARVELARVVGQLSLPWLTQAVRDQP